MSYKKSASRSGLLAAAVAAVLVSGCNPPPLPGTLDYAEPRTAPRRSAPCSSGYNAPGGDLKIKSGAPGEYVVKRGDTLWGISGMYLEKPWRWKELWKYNKQIKNPHLIYPGDVVRLSYDGSGKPSLTVVSSSSARSGGGIPTYRMTKRGETLMTDLPINSITRDDIEGLINKNIVMSQAQIDASPYVLAAEEARNLGSLYDRIYVRGARFTAGETYHVYTPTYAYPNHYPRNAEEAKTPLGFNMLRSGDISIERSGEDPTPAIIQKLQAGIRPGDRLVKYDAHQEYNTEKYFFIPEPAPSGTEATVIGSPNPSIVSYSNMQTVTIDIGTKNGCLKPGQVLQVQQGQRISKDPVTGEDMVLPDEKVGVVMVYNVFDNVSHALVMSFQKGIRRGDRLVPAR